MIPATRNGNIANWPLGELATLRSEINGLLESQWLGFEREVFSTWAPALDVSEEKDALSVRLELPGVKKEDIAVSLHDGTLTISGERKPDSLQKGETRRTERFVGRFQRSIVLPSTVSAAGVKAAYVDGILSVHLPKAEEAKPRQIEINVK